MLLSDKALNDILYARFDSYNTSFFLFCFFYFKIFRFVWKGTTIL